MRNGQSMTPKQRDSLMSGAREEPRIPSVARRATNLAKATVKHVADGLKKVDFDTYKNRLAVCNKCDIRVKNICTDESCGCFIDKKAWWSSEDCPLGRWQEDSGV